MTTAILMRTGYINLLQTIVVSLRISAKRIPVLFFFIISSLTSFDQATKVGITTQPVPNNVNGSQMSVQPVVEIRNASNQLVTTSTAQVEIVIASGNGGSLGGTIRINAVNGIATFTNLTFTGIKNEPYVFQFKSEPVIAYEPFAYAGGSLTRQQWRHRLVGGLVWREPWLHRLTMTSRVEALTICVSIYPPAFPRV